MYEIEFRAMFDLVVYNRLREFLDSEAKKLGDDDKDVRFFMFPDKLLKVVENVSKNNAFIVLKMNRIGKGSDFEEFEVPIDRGDVKLVTRMFKALGFTNTMRTFQKRINYVYNGVELALKWSKVWGYHLELEVMIEDLDDKPEAEQLIRKVAGQLKVSIMSEDELANFVDEVEKKNKLAKKKRG